LISKSRQVEMGCQAKSASDEGIYNKEIGLFAGSIPQRQDHLEGRFGLVTLNRLCNPGHVSSRQWSRPKLLSSVLEIGDCLVAASATCECDSNAQ